MERGQQTTYVHSPETGGCETPAAVTAVAGSGLKPEGGIKVVDNNLRTKWVAKGKGESLWLGLASPTVIDSVAIAFRKVRGWTYDGYFGGLSRARIVFLSRHMYVLRVAGLNL